MIRNSSITSVQNSTETSPLNLPIFFLIFLAGLVILFSEFLFSCEMLLSVDMLESGLYHRTFLVDCFKEYGSIPQWDPYQYGGMPYVDAFHGDIFYPLSVLKFFIPVYLYIGLTMVLHIFLAGVFMFLVSRDFGLNKTASLVSAANYMFAPYLVSLVASGHDGNIYVASLFPLIILFLNRGFRSRPLFNFSLLGLVLGMIFLSPHPRLSYFTLWAIALFAIYKLATGFRANKSIKMAIKPILFIMYSLVIALSFSAIQIYPGYDYTSSESIRTKEQHDWTWATSYSLHEEDVVSQLIPEFSGFTSITNDEGYYWGKNAFKYSVETVGIVSLLLALIGLSCSKRKDAYFLGGLALIALFYALGATTPIFKIFYSLVPLVHTLRAPAMIMFLFSFSISLLAGMGIQTIINSKQRDALSVPKKFHYLMASFVLLMLLLAILFTFVGRETIMLWTSIFFESASVWEVEGGLTKLDLAILNLPSVQFGAWLAFIFILFTAILIWIYTNRKNSILLLSLITILIIVDGVRFNKRFVSTINHESYQNKNSVVDFFLNDKDYYRVFNLDAPYPAEMLCQFGIDLVDGRHGNQIRTYSEMLRRSFSSQTLNPRFFNLVGTRYLLHAPGKEIHADLFGTIPLRVEKSFNDFDILRNDNAFKRLYLVNSYEVLPELEDIFHRALEGRRDLKEIVYLEESPDINIPPPPAKLASDSTWIISKSVDSILIGTHCTSNRLLVLIENYYDAWQVYIDGRPAKILRAYGSFRAVAVPAGAKRVLFKYRSEEYELGKIISALTSIFLLFILGINMVKQRLNKEPVPIR